MKKKVLAMTFSIIMGATLFLSGCSTQEGGSIKESKTQEDQGAKDEGKEMDNKEEKKDGAGGYTIGLAMNTQTNPFFVDVKDGVQKAADEHGIQLIITDAQDDPAIQMKDVENLITKKPDAIIIDTCDSDAIVAAVEACNDADIPVFTMDRESNGGKVISHIGYDAIKSGTLAGQYLVDTLKGKGNIVELQGIMGTNVAQQRSQGFHSVIEKNTDMNLVASQVADFDRAKAMSVTENILQANDKIDGLYAANDEMLLGALEAVEAAGRLDEITMIGCDAIDDTLEAIKSGKVNATIAEPPFFLGKAILNAAYDHLEGKAVDEKVVLDNELVTKENVDKLVTKEK